MIQTELSWSFYQIWNESLEENKSEKALSSREKIWASELGGCQIDRYLKMTALPPSNPPNPRSLRKFEAGNIWEAIIGFVLNRAGILIKKQEWLSYQYPNLLPVVGKLDFIAGGKPDYEKAITIITQSLDWLPPFISTATQKIVTRLKKEYPDGLSNIILELKSCSAFMYEKYEKQNESSPHHKLQLFHYLKAKNMPEGHIVYISKDDARLIEIGVLNPSTIENKYKKDIEEMTYFITHKEEPPKEKSIVFDEIFGSFSANWKIGYSNYLTYLYGFKNQKEFDDKYKPIVERWNRILKRLREKKEMTTDNLQGIEEIKKANFNIEHCLEPLGIRLNENKTKAERIVK